VGVEIVEKEPLTVYGLDIRGTMGFCVAPFALPNR